MGYSAVNSGEFPTIPQNKHAVSYSCTNFPFQRNSPIYFNILVYWTT